ncbi:MAG: hypothetical protein ABSC56_13190 [Solirubrobacteraceae bacterium]|jgi:hypothetical protein
MTEPGNAVSAQAITALAEPHASAGAVRIRMLRLVGLVAFACLALSAGSATLPAAASAAPLPDCGNYANYTGSGIPAGSGIPPWGFHASQSFPGGGSGFAWGWGDVNLATSWISGRICEQLNGPKGVIAIKVGPQISYQSHYAVLWGYEGNLIKTSLTVTSSTDPACAVGTTGHITMYASYNGVRSDSMQFFFDAGCADQDHLYHGQVVAQVPPL